VTGKKEGGITGPPVEKKGVFQVAEGSLIPHRVGVGMLPCDRERHGKRDVLSEGWGKQKTGKQKWLKRPTISFRWTEKDKKGPAGPRRVRQTTDIMG